MNLFNAVYVYYWANGVNWAPFGDENKNVQKMFEVGRFALMLVFTKKKLLNCCSLLSRRIQSFINQEKKKKKKRTLLTTGSTK